MSDIEAWDARYSADAVHIRAVLAMLPDLQSRSATLAAIRGLKLSQMRVLEIGCGTGQHSVALAREYPDWRYDAIDMSPRAIEAARALAIAAQTGVKFSIGDAEKLPYPDASFDVVFGDHVIGHIPDQDAALEEIARVLKPGGYVLLNVGNALRIDGWPLYHALTDKKYLARAMFPWTLGQLVRRHGCQTVGSFGSVLILTRGLALLIPSRRRASGEGGVKTGTIAITTARTSSLVRRLYRWCDAHAPAWLKTDYGIVAQKRS
jgi:ubiquinone/menaquinone biosynthesis C-methylase UbiE